ncbi:MAG: hypothetical protein WDA26_06990 [Pusillimonas sp.]
MRVLGVQLLFRPGFKGLLLAQRTKALSGGARQMSKVVNSAQALSFSTGCQAGHCPGLAIIIFRGIP